MLSPGASPLFCARAHLSFDNEFRTRWYSDLARAVNAGHEGQPRKRDAERDVRRRDSEAEKEIRNAAGSGWFYICTRVYTCIPVYILTCMRTYMYIYSELLNFWGQIETKRAPGLSYIRVDVPCVCVSAPPPCGTIHLRPLEVYVRSRALRR